MNAIVLSNATMRRATAIAQRTNSIEMGIIKAMQIETLKTKIKKNVHLSIKNLYIFCSKSGSFCLFSGNYGKISLISLRD